VAVAEDSGQTMSGWLHALRRTWFVGFLLGMVLSAPLTVFAWIFSEPQFRSDAIFRVHTQAKPLAFATADQATANRNDMKSFKNTQKQMLLTPVVLNAALRTEGISNLPSIVESGDGMQFLSQSLTVTFPEDSELMRVELRSRHQHEARQILEAVVSSFMTEVVLAEQSDKMKRLNTLQKAYLDTDDKIRVKRTDLRKLVEALGAGDAQSLNLVQQTAVQQYGLMMSELTKTQLELLRAQGELESLEAMEKEAQKAKELAAQEASANGEEMPAAAASAAAAEELISPELQLALDRDATYTKLVNERDRIEVQIKQAQERLSGARQKTKLEQHNAQLEDVNKRISDRKSLLAAAIENSRPRSGAVENKGRRGIDDLHFRIAALKKQESTLRAEAERKETEGRRFGRSSIDVEMLRAEIASLEEVARSLHSEIERTKVELNASGRVALVSNASPAIPSGDLKKRVAVTGAACVIGLLSPMLILVLRDSSMRRLNTRHDVASTFDAPVVAEIPRIPAQYLRHGRVNSAESGQWSEILHESVATIATFVVRMAQSEDRRVLYIGSSTSGEGKTTVASRLAACLARSGHRTLLIDFDLYRPNINKSFGMENSNGVAEVLQGQQKLEDVVRTTAIPELAVLPAGHSPKHLLRHTLRGSLAKLFQEARLQYEFVIVDSSPLLSIAAMRTLAANTDGVLLVVRRDNTRMPLLEATVEVLQQAGAHLLGFVFSGTKAQPEYHYYSSAPRAKRLGVADASKKNAGGSN
jgi:capsular exopolysaccharide synthesis family protein